MFKITLTSSKALMIIFISLQYIIFIRKIIIIKIKLSFLVFELVKISSLNIKSIIKLFD